ncbi:MAG: PEP-CTERM sorting domain-containing protein [Planctomycetota bacterium]
MTRTISAIALAVAASPAMADTVTFDPVDGYALGTSLVVNPDWAGNGALYSITSLGDGNGAALSAATPQTPFANNRFTPSAAFLGTDTTDTAGQAYEFGFLLGSPQAATETGFGLAHRIRIGGTDGAPIVDFQIFDNGRLQYFAGPGAGPVGNGYQNVVNLNGNPLLLDDLGGRNAPLEGRIDFDNNTYELSFDGVVQGTFPLLNTPSTFGQVTLQWGTSTSAPDYRQILIDDLAIDGVDARLPGDANGDGTVDLADFGILRANFGADDTIFASGDFNADNTVDLADFGILRANFGSSAAADIAAMDAWYATVVPEPTSLAAVGLAGALILRRRR